MSPFEPRSAPESELHWADVEDTASSNDIGRVDWVRHWGTPVASPELTAKVATYELIAHLLDGDGDAGQWSVRPAKLIHNTDAEADAPDSAFTLTSAFSSLAGSVQWYVTQIGSPSWDQGTIWHEPLWLVSRDDEPRLVLDEAGHVHLTTSSLSEVLSVVVATAELGGIDDPYGFDLLEALPQVQGSLAELAKLLRRGPGETLLVVKPPHHREEVTGMEDGSIPTSNPVEKEPRMIADRRLMKLHRTPVTWESKVRGLMIGLALGDADIAGGKARTPEGILLAGAATQMAAWTAEGLLRRATRYGTTDITGRYVSSTAVDSITYAYQRWARLRGIARGYDDVEHPGWLQDVPAMAERRSHSSSLEQAMATGEGSLRDTCRPVIRALPIAVYAGRDHFTHCDAHQAGKYARSVAEITHQNHLVGDASELAVRIAVHCLGHHESFVTAFEGAISEDLVPPGLVKVVLAARAAAARPADRQVLCQLVSRVGSSL